MDHKQIFSLIDHTNLKADITREDVALLCDQAKRYGFKSVCVHPYYVAAAYAELKGSAVAVCSVAGFPLGMNTARTKADEAAECIGNGAAEIDMVINIGAAKSGDWAYIENEISRIKRAVGANILKCILETCYLTDAEKVNACESAVSGGADFVKTSTGLARMGATVSDVALMRRTVGTRCGVKAAGGIRTLDDCIAMIDAGATRIGVSGAMKLVEEALAPQAAN